jgi:hypothetical protein
MAKDSIPYWEGPGAELVDETARNRIAGNINRAEAMTPAQLSLWASCYPSGAGSQMWKGFGSRRQAVVEPRSSSLVRSRSRRRPYRGVYSQYMI